MYACILVPIDHSSQGQLGLEEATKLAAALAAKIRLVHVVDLRMLIQGVAGYAPTEQLIEEWKAAGEKLVAEACARVREKGVAVESVVLCDPALRICDAIIEEAKKAQAQLIVMGTHGRRGFSRLVMGSDAELVLRSSPVPVMLVRGEEPQPA
ncbi:universal stress protein [Sphaerotilaceae bacterium SBD11-9]